MIPSLYPAELIRRTGNYKGKRIGEPGSVGRGNIPSVSLWICRLKRQFITFVVCQSGAIEFKNQKHLRIHVETYCQELFK